MTAAIVTLIPFAVLGVGDELRGLPMGNVVKRLLDGARGDVDRLLGNRCRGLDGVVCHALGGAHIQLGLDLLEGVPRTETTGTFHIELQSLEPQEFVVGRNGSVAVREGRCAHQPHVAALPTQLHQIFLRLGAVLDQILDLVQHQPTERLLRILRHVKLAGVHPTVEGARAAGTLDAKPSLVAVLLDLITAQGLGNFESSAASIERWTVDAPEGIVPNLRMNKIQGMLVTIVRRSILIDKMECRNQQNST